MINFSEALQIVIPLCNLMILITFLILYSQNRKEQAKKDSIPANRKGIELLNNPSTQALFSASPDAIVVVNGLDGTILLANHHAYHLFGWQSETLVGQNLDVLIPERFRIRHKANRLGFMQDRVTREMGPGLDLFALRKDSSEVPVYIGLTPYGVDSVIAYIRPIQGDHLLKGSPDNFFGGKKIDEYE